MKRLTVVIGRTLLLVAVAVAVASQLSGCWAILPAQVATSLLDRGDAIEGEPTEVFDWGAPRDAPEMAEALERVKKDDKMRTASVGEGLNGQKDVGDGRFLGVVVSWMPPDATLSDPNSYAEVLVTPDGRIGAAPEVYQPCGFVSNGELIEEDSPEMARYKRDAVRLARGYVGPGITAGPNGFPESVDPFVSAYVVEYPWGVVTTAPDVNAAVDAYTQAIEKPEGGWLLIRPLSKSQRARFDSLTATEVATTYLTSQDEAEVYWLAAPEVRLYLLSDPQPFMHRAETATVDLVEGRPKGADPQELAFRVEPAGLLNADCLLFISRATPAGPWRIMGEGQ